MVSICIPVYNGASLIHRALGSATRQTYKNIEIVVVDTASTDNTKKAVEDYSLKDKRIKYFRNKSNIGFTRNLLKSYSLASGEYVQLLCHDDWLSRNHIQEGVEQFRRNPQTAGVFTASISVRMENEKCVLIDRVAFAPALYSREYFVGHMYKTQWASTCILSLLRRKDILEASQLIDRFLESAEEDFKKFYAVGVAIDWLLFLKIIANYAHLTFTDASTYIKLDHAHNVGKQHGWDLKDAKGVFEYYSVIRYGLETLYAQYFPQCLLGMRVFMGAEAMDTALINFIRDRFNSERLRGFGHLGIFLKKYPLTHKAATIFYAIPLFFWRLARFMVRRKKVEIKITDNANFFIDKDGAFRA